ncbi:MAG: YeaH/YhbH family protein [Gammaproteobacteria bacterium]|nr:YeaH/YhbH family protein [Gammaproteobacteria bacterium]
MSHVIDRRLDGKNKSAANRQRFMRRYRERLKKAVSDAVEQRSITDMDKGEKVSIPSKDISEPVFHHSQGGRREVVQPGNQEYLSGDRVKRPPGGAGGGGSQASDDGEGEDDFVFELSRKEFLDLMFEDLALPDMIKRRMTRDPDYKYLRAGYTTTGVPSNINVVRSLRQSLARRMAMSAGRRTQLHDAEAQLQVLLKTSDESNPQVVALQTEIERLRKRVNAVPFIDSFDLRYNNRVKVPKPSTQAVMFCLMDVSGSMDEQRKALAKQFFILLHLFLQRNYERIDIVFIRHHTVAREVDEHEFFHARETGGTVVSSALVLMRQIMRDRYPASAWNIYAAQASDGDNWLDDSPGCGEILARDILPYTQYFAYVEITPREHQSLWHEYVKLAEATGNFAMTQIDSPQDIYPVFRELFKRQDA